ncbi:hypothetical protein EV363DRAFT_1381371, partial [Boletus edulis]
MGKSSSKISKTVCLRIILLSVSCIVAFSQWFYNIRTYYSLTSIIYSLITNNSTQLTFWAPESPRIRPKTFIRVFERSRACV